MILLLDFEAIPKVWYFLFLILIWIAYHSRAPEFTPGFKWGSCQSIFSFIRIIL